MKKLSWLLGFLCFSVMQVQALSLHDDMQLMNQRVFQPFHAKVEVLNVPSNIAVNEIKVELASQDVYDKFSMDRQFYLTKLDFAVKRQGKQVFVEISSRELVKESYLMLVLAVKWPGKQTEKQLFRDYLLLFDAPK